MTDYRLLSILGTIDSGFDPEFLAGLQKKLEVIAEEIGVEAKPLHPWQLVDPQSLTIDYGLNDD